MESFKEIAESLIEESEQFLNPSYNNGTSNSENDEDRKDTSGRNIHSNRGFVGAVMAALKKIEPLELDNVALIKNSLISNKQDYYTTRDVSVLTGIEDWKIRRYISSGKLNTKNSNDNLKNPGKAGYLITKESLLNFIESHPDELSKSKKFENHRIQGLAKVESFISRFQITEEIGNYEIEKDKIRNKEETEESLEKKILLKKLQLQRIKFEEILKEHSLPLNEE